MGFGCLSELGFLGFGFGCLECCAGGVLLAPPFPSPSPPAPLPLLLGALGERGVDGSPWSCLPFM